MCDTSSAEDAALGSSNTNERLEGLAGLGGARSCSRLNASSWVLGRPGLLFGASTFDELRLRPWLSILSLLPVVNAALRREPCRLWLLSWPSSTLLEARLLVCDWTAGAVFGDAGVVVGKGTVPWLMDDLPILCLGACGGFAFAAFAASPELLRKNDTRDKMFPEELRLCVLFGIKSDFERWRTSPCGPPFSLRGDMEEDGVAGDCGVAFLDCEGFTGSWGSGREREARVGGTSCDLRSTMSMVDALRISVVFGLFVLESTCEARFVLGLLSRRFRYRHPSEHVITRSPAAV